MNAFDLLKQDHQKVRTLCSQMGTTGERDTMKREEIFRQVKQEVDVHTKIEEQCLYPLAKKYKETQEITERSLEEHQQIKQLLQELSRKEVQSEDWLPTFKTLQECFEDHVEEEESEMFPKLQKILSRDEMSKLGDDLQSMKTREMESIRR